MAKKTDNRFVLILNIFWEGLCIYCKYLDTFLKYMLFPVFGMIAGAALIFTVNYFFIVNIPSLIKQYPILDNIPLVFTLLLICVFPGFLIFCKAFFDYIIAYASLNSMVYVSRGAKMKNKPLDTKTHDDVLKKRLGKYLVMLLIFSIMGIIGIFPLFIIPFGIICIYFCLIFQVFMLEESTTPINAFTRSFNLVKGNFLITFTLIALSFILTYWLLPDLFVWLFEKINILQYLIYPVQKYLDILPIKEITDSMMSYIASSLAASPVSLDITPAFDTSKFAKDIVTAVIAAAVTGLLLPLRCAWFTLLYKLFDAEKTEELRKCDFKKS